MNEKELQELEYERDMQEQAECMSRWKLRKEIKKKLRELRKKVRKDKMSLPQLQTISSNLDRIENPLQKSVAENSKKIANFDSCEKNLEIVWQPCHTEHYRRNFAYDPRMVIAPSTSRIEDVILKQMSEEFGYELLKAGAIQYRICDNAIMEHKKQVEMKVDVVVAD